MLIVENDPVKVETDLLAGAVACPVCEGRLAPWGFARLGLGDALHGPVIGRHKAILFAFLDDHSRMFTGYRWVTAEDTVRAEVALRGGLASRGVPTTDAVYLDYADLRVMPTCGDGAPSSGSSRTSWAAARHRIHGPTAPPSPDRAIRLTLTD